MTTNTDYSVAFVTAPTTEVADNLIKAILEAKLAACVNKIPGIESSYWWEGSITTDKEHLLMIKTKTSLVDELVTFVKKNHTYSVPEVISVPIQKGNSDYLAWIENNVKKQ